MKRQSMMLLTIATMLFGTLSDRVFAESRIPPIIDNQFPIAVFDYPRNAFPAWLEVYAGEELAYKQLSIQGVEGTINGHYVAVDADVYRSEEFGINKCLTIYNLDESTTAWVLQLWASPREYNPLAVGLIYYNEYAEEGQSATYHYSLTRSDVANIDLSPYPSADWLFKQIWIQLSVEEFLAQEEL